MSVISFGPNQKLTQQQRAAYQTSQKVKQAVWETSHRLAALNNVPGVDDPSNGDNVDISTPTPLPTPPQGSVAVFEANATGSVKRSEDGQLQKADVHSHLADGREWDTSYQHQGDTLSYSAPAPSGQGQVHVVENLSNGTISMFEAPQFVPDFTEQLQNFTPPAPATPLPAPAAPPSAPGWSAPAEEKKESGFGGFFKKLTGQSEKTDAPSIGTTISDKVQEGKTRATDAVKSDSGRKWGKLLIGGLGMEMLDKAMGGNEPEAAPEAPQKTS